MKHMKLMIGALATAAVMCSPALGQQDGRQGRQARPGMGAAQQQMNDEQAKAVWTWQARDVALALDVSADHSKKLVEIYTTSRADLRTALQQMRRDAMQARQRDGYDRGQRGQRGDRGQRGQMGRAGAGFNAELLDSHRTALQGKLTEALGEKYATKAVESLGVFNPQWDQMVHTLVGLELPDEQMYAALRPVREYAAALVSLREITDRQAMRETMMEARQSLMTDLGNVLNEEQLAAFQPRRRGGDAQPQRRAAPPVAAQPEDEVQEAVTVAEVGKAAPDFTLTDASGKQHTLSDYAGKTVVLQWINPDCPVCVRVFRDGLVASMREEIQKIDKEIVHLTINTTHYMEGETSAAYLKNHKIEVPALIDRDGTVGRLYDARTTPQMYVIDAEGILRYNGAIDDDQRGRNENRTNFVVQAVRQLAAGETVSPATTRPYGCTVKVPPSSN